MGLIAWIVEIHAADRERILFALEADRVILDAVTDGIEEFGQLYATAVAAAGLSSAGSSFGSRRLVWSWHDRIAILLLLLTRKVANVVG